MRKLHKIINFYMRPYYRCSERAAINGDIDANLVHLELSWKLLSARLGNFDGRGFVLLEKALLTEYTKRIPRYRRAADVTLKCNHKTNAVLVTELAALISS